MAERSHFWSGDSVGDAAQVTDDDFTDVLSLFLSYDRREEGILDTGHTSYPGGLQVSGGAGSVTVSSGVALVDGKPYTNSAGVAVAIPTPSVSTRFDRIVLRKSWALQTVRITRVAGVEGGGIPAITQVDGTTWDIPLAYVEITTGAVIAVVAEGVAMRAPNGIGYQYAELSGNDSSHTAPDWNNLGASGVRITCGPGKWAIFALLAFTPTTSVALRQARIRNNTGGSTVIEARKTPAIAAGYDQIALGPYVVDLSITTQLELQYYAQNAADVVYGANYSNSATNLYAFRVV